MYTAQQLCGHFEGHLNPRLLRKYREVGAVSKPLGGRGKNAYYTNEHVRQIRAVLAAKESNLRLIDLAVRHGNRPGE